MPCRNVTKENVGIVVLDLGLPCGGGFFVLENLQKNRKRPQMRIIVSTANIVPGIEDTCKDAGADDFLLKPMIWRSCWR